MQAMGAMGNSQHLDQLMDAQLRDEAKEHSKKLKKFKKVQIHLTSLCLWNVVISNLQMQAIPWWWTSLMCPRGPCLGSRHAQKHVPWADIIKSNPVRTLFIHQMHSLNWLNMLINWRVGSSIRHGCPWILGHTWYIDYQCHIWLYFYSLLDTG